MKRYARLVVAVVVAALVLAGCGMPLSPGQEGAASVSLPPDEVRDVSRSVSGPFTFETLFSVGLRLSVDLYETDESGRVTEEPLPPEVADVFVTLDDSEGNRVYAGMFGDDGMLEASVQLPSAAEDMTLTVRAAGFVQRTIVIDDMVTFELIDRTLSLRRVVPGARGPVSRNGTDAPDADGDGVPDSEDAEPEDPTIAFYAYVPSRESITVAYEDLFGREDINDADYNDFIASYTIREGLNADNEVTQIYVAAEAVQKLAGYDHRFGIRLDSFDGTASVSGSFTDLTGTSREYSFRPIAGTAEIDLFLNSRYAKGKTAEFTVTFDEPQVRDGSDDALPEAPYNPYLFVYNTGHDIHLIGREANTISRNPDDPFVDANDFPWALLVPRDWIHPEEGVRIEVDYPRFTLWRESGGTEHQDWYDHYQDPWEPGGGGEDATVYVAGYYNDGTRNVAAYWVDDATGIRLVDLYTESLSQATGIAVDESGVVHAVGWYNTAAGQVAAYWRGDTRYDLETPARATGIVLDSEGTAYISGYYNDGSKNLAAYWTVAGETVTLHQLNPASRSQATGIDIDSSGAVYASGYLNDGTQDVAVYWTATGSGVSTEQLYTGGFSRAYAIDHDAGSTYVAGQYVDGAAVAAYWVDNASGLFVLNGESATPRSIARSGDQTIVAGDYLSGAALRRPVHWTGGDPQELPTDPTDATGFAYDLAALGGDIYVTGSQKAGVDEAVYWKDGSLVVLSAGVQSRALAITAIQ
jgi:LruC domain-containing protein